MSFTYNTLTSTITKYVVDTGGDFRELLPVIIENAVRLCAREVSPVLMDTTTTVVFAPTTITDNVVILPDTVDVVKQVTFTNTATGQRNVLKHRPVNVVTAYNVNNSATYTAPEYYGRKGQEEIILGPYTITSGTLEVTHTAVSIPSLANPDSDLLTKYPDFILAGCMVESYLVKMDEENARLWQLRYDRIRDSIENEARRNRRDDTSSPNNLSKSSTNSLSGSK